MPESDSQRARQRHHCLAHLCLGLILSAMLAATASADEIKSLDEWWTAYDASIGAGDVAKSLQLVAEYKRYAAMAFNEGLANYRTHREQKDIGALRKFYAFLDLLSRQIQEKHGIDTYVGDLAKETKDDDEWLQGLKISKDAKIITDSDEFNHVFIDLLRADKSEEARQLVVDNMAISRKSYFEFLQEWRLAFNADDRQRMLNIHTYLEPLQEFVVEASPPDDFERYQQHEAPPWLEAYIAETKRLAEVAQAEAEGKAAKTGPGALEIARKQVAKGIALREKNEWEQAIAALRAAQDALQYVGVSQQELIEVHHELARTYLAYGDFPAAARSYREMGRAAAFVGLSDKVKEAHEILSKLPPDNRPEMDNEDHWGRWQTAKLKAEDSPGKGEDPHGPLREADPRVQLWSSVDLTVATSAPIGPPGVQLVKLNDEVMLDIDGDGKGDLQPDLAKGTALKFESAYPDGSKQPYAIQMRRFRVFDYMEFTFDHSQRTVIFWRRVGWRETRLGNTRIIITDDSGDGHYDGYGRDGMVIGQSTVGTKLSRIFSTGPDIFEIDVHPNGTTIGYRKYSGPTQIVTGSTAVGIARNFIVVSTEDPDVMMELAPTGKPFKIPVGKWRFQEALLVDKTLADSVWVQNDHCPVIEVKKDGSPESFDIGRELAYDLHTSYDATTKEVRVHGLTLKITGGFGEVYSGYYPTTVLPILSILMKIKDSVREIDQAAQTLQRTSTSTNYRDVEFPKDLIFEFEMENTVFTKIAVDHPILGEWITPYRTEEVEVSNDKSAAPAGGAAPDGGAPGQEPPPK